MNDLSILLYLADTLPTFAGWLVFFAVLLTILSVINLCIATFVGIEAYDTEEEAKQVRAACRKISIICIPALVACVLLSSLIPSKQTFYLIAGSEMGEVALKTEAAQKVEQYLNHLLDNQMKTSEE